MSNQQGGIPGGQPYGGPGGPQGPHRPQQQFGQTGGQPYGPQSQGSPYGPNSPGSASMPPGGAYAGAGGWQGQGPGPQGPSGPQGPGPHGPSGPQGPGGQPKKKNLKWLLIAGGAVIVVLAIIFGVVGYQNYQREQEAQRAEEARIAAEQQQTEDATATADKLGEALAGGDIGALLEIVANPPEEGEAVTNPEVVRAALDRAPLEGLEVGEPQLTGGGTGRLDGGTVDITWNQGGNPVTVTYDLVREGEAWKVDGVFVELTIDSDFPVLLEGQEIEPGRTYYVLPLTYGVTSGNARVQFTEGQLTIDPTQSSASWTGEAELSEEGRNLVVERAKAELDRCLASKELAPSACPMIRWRTESGVSPNLSTLRYTLENDPFAGAEPVLSGTDGELDISTTISVYADATVDGQPGYIDGEQTRQVTAYVDLTNPDAPLIWG
ncbi:YfgM family protein [Parenemella sanctibonifatiensis]|uniref:DUF4878 domain-containing protein n=1 Tax=Parenemella sanctibonifatiensis TaxID=2016505 RepID=A0A255EIA5_9ACTN|nr:hypothetical protein [Parenemella sanctibonifatiensis]OYN91244.1 hypothetical protein CGZ91_07270 [Parenemella sanctibonifatiensis]